MKNSDDDLRSLPDTFQLYVPTSLSVGEPEFELEDAVTLHSLNIRGSRESRVVDVVASGLREQWDGTIETMIALGDAVAKKSTGWDVDQIEIGLTLSAKGQLLLIAEAGAEASITVTLKRRSATAQST